MIELPLFPLSTVLFPHGRLPLQIFEQRYIDLVRDSLKADRGFGIVLLRRGGELSQPGQSEPELGDYGTVARIVDWDQLPNGLLGITVQGCETFELLDTKRRPDGLNVGEVELTDAPQPQPMQPAWRSLEDVLRGLEIHPHVQRMGLTIDYNDAWQVAYWLAQLLPLEESLKYELLGTDSLESLMKELDIILNQISA